MNHCSQQEETGPSTPPSLLFTSTMGTLALCTLMHALPFSILYLFGFWENFSHYEPIMPVVCPIVASFLGAIAMLGQMVAAIFLWFRSPKVVSISGQSAGCLVLSFGVASVGALPFNEWSTAILMGFGSVWPIILHFAVKRLFHTSQTRVLQTRTILEIIAYLVAGVFAAIVGLGMAASVVAAFPALMPFCWVLPQK